MITQKFITKIVEILEQLQIKYAISGGFAVSVWGRPRNTADVDIVVDIKTTESVEKLIDKLQQGFKKSYADLDQALGAFKRKGEFNLVEPEYGLKADFFIISDDPQKELEIERARDKDIGGKLVKFISPEDLIIAKLIWFKDGQSTRQLEDIASVIDTQKDLDKKYIQEWVRKLKLVEEWQKVGELKLK